MRTILHHGADPTSPGAPLDERAVAGCWFEWHRQGGCGPGELRLERRWAESADLLPGDWISIGTTTSDRWYLGRIETWQADYPAGVRVTLAGMVSQLNEIFPGGFGGDDINPERHGRTDAFLNDPDHGIQQTRATQTVSSIVNDLVQQHILLKSNVVAADPVVVTHDTPVDSLTLQGEESVRSLLKDLAVRAGGMSWGVDQRGHFFFRPTPTETTATFRLSDDVLRCVETRERDVLFNRLQITGDFVYDEQDAPGGLAHRSYRYRRVFERTTSLAQFGEHRVRLWLPWIRTDHDARAFAESFFNQYAAPASKFLIEALPGDHRPFPWAGPVRLLNESGQVVAIGTPSVVRVSFDTCPTVRVEIGPEDPRRLWPDPGVDERYEIPPQRPETTTVPSSFESSFSSDSTLPSGDLPPPLPTSQTPPSTNDPTSWASWNNSSWTSEDSWLTSSDWSSLDSSVVSSASPPSSTPPLSSTPPSSGVSSSTPSSQWSSEPTSSDASSNGPSSDPPSSGVPSSVGSSSQALTSAPGSSMGGTTNPWSSFDTSSWDDTSEWWSSSW